MVQSIVPTDGLLITETMQLRPGTYYLPAGLTIGRDEVVLNGHGATLIGENKSGRGLTIKNCRNVTVKNLRVLNYYHGIYAENCDHLLITGCQVTTTAEIPPNTVFLDIWQPADRAYGAGICLWQVAHSRIEGNDLQHQMNGLLSYYCHHLEVRRNIANYCSGFGFHLFETEHSHFSRNYADFCCRQYLDRAQGGLGADSAGFLIVHKSCHNVFRQNYARSGGDGFFLAGLTPAGELVACNHNLFEENDGSYSPNNAFEATFSRGNQFRRNLANASNYGFWLGFSRENVLEDNQIWGNRQAGIAVENGIEMVVRRNDLRDNRYGLLLWSRYNPAFAKALPENDTSREWLIEQNIFRQNNLGIRIAANQDHGLHPLARSVFASPLPHGHTIRRNQIHHNRVGIELEGVTETRIEHNDLHDNLSGDVVNADETRRLG